MSSTPTFISSVKGLLTRNREIVIPLGVEFGLLALSCIQAGINYSYLPEQVASHFNIKGVADGHMSRGALIGLYLGLQFCLSIPLSAAFFLIKKVPDQFINLPNKIYWLAPVRRDKTLDFIIAQLLWSVCVVEAFMMALFQGLFFANIRDPTDPRINPFLTWTLVILMLGLGGFIVYRLVTKFKQQEEPEEVFVDDRRF